MLGAVIVEDLSWHWLFWAPLVVTLLAALATWRYVPESPVRSPGHVNWLAAALMSLGMCCVLIAIAQTTVWGWGGTKTIALLAAGAVVIAAWIWVEVHSREPLVDMSLMRIRGVWTTNLVAFLLGAGMYSSFIIYPQFAQLPKSTGFGFGASVVVSSLYLLPAAVGMGVLGTAAGRVARRFGSKPALIVGTAITAVAFGWLAVAHGHPYDMLISATLLGIGIGLAFAALGNLIVQAVPASPDRRRDRDEHRDADPRRSARRSARGDVHRRPQAHGLPTVTGFDEAFLTGDRVPDRVRPRRAAHPRSPARGRRAARGTARGTARRHSRRGLTRPPARAPAFPAS